MWLNEQIKLCSLVSQLVNIKKILFYNMSDTLQNNISLMSNFWGQQLWNEIKQTQNQY